MAYDNIPAVRFSKLDGNLLPETASVAPRVMVIGRAGSGVSKTFYRVATTSAARSEFGLDGDLIQGMYEAKQSGATEIGLYRIGARPAIVEGIGDSTGTAGITVQTVEEDESAGANYSLYYEDSTGRLVIKRNSDSLVVYDNDSSSPIDRGEVYVSGAKATGGGDDIGSASGYVDLEDISVTGTTYTAGADGLNLSKMELYEELYRAYKDLVRHSFDVVVPMGANFDEKNVVDQGDGSTTPVVPGGSSYPTAGANLPGSDVDALGQVYVERYQGEYYFWWWFDDGSGEFTAADISPSVGSASDTTKIDGTALTESDFHEVNFGYQLARFLHDYSTTIVDAVGVLPVRPPESFSSKELALWLGESPTLTLNNTTNEYYIASDSDNGSGLLGNKFKAGMAGWRSGHAGGGMILTDTEFLDGQEQTDANGAYIDLGKYISVVCDEVLTANGFNTNGYRTNMAATYAGLFINNDPSDAPTNQVVPGVRLLTSLSFTDINSLVGARYVTLRQKVQGLVVADAPTSSLATSDWRRLSTVRIIKSVSDAIRNKLDPFLGRGTSESTRASMQSLVEEVLLQAKRFGYIQAYASVQIIQTPAMEVTGNIEIPLSIQPAFEIRFIDVPISLSNSLVA